MGAPGQRKHQLVPLGYICGAHGVRGWVKIHSFTQPIEAILAYQPWLLGADRRPVTIRDGSLQGKTVIAQLPDVDDRNLAMMLLRQEIAVYREQLPDLPGSEYYWADLEGLEVITIDGVELGRITRMLATGANDVMIVDGDRERLIPFVPGQYVTGVDLEAGQLEVDWDPEF